MEAAILANIYSFSFSPADNSNQIPMPSIRETRTIVADTMNLEDIPLKGSISRSTV
jgi:hypothetical protein